MHLERPFSDYIMILLFFLLSLPISYLISPQRTLPLLPLVCQRYAHSWLISWLRWFEPPHLIWGAGANSRLLTSNQLE
ncbi:hypothetical protein HOY80DRAFT_57369 [Tuber brumale]|nr:hypothetical protein HOY80DRAFT_57369 [Tuber brumale]